MANELQLQTEPIQADLSAGAVIRNAAGQVWNPANSAFEVFADASITTYAVTMAEQGTRSGYYVGDFPAGITQAGTYTVVVYDLDDTTDIIGAGEVTWHGSASSAVAGSGQTYGVTAAFSVPNAQTGQAGNLSGQFYGADGVAVGDPVNATFIEKGSTGCYGLTCASPGSGSYFLVLSLSGTVLPGPALPVAPPANVITEDAVWSASTRTLTNGTIVVVRPWQTGSLNVVKGDSYLAADGTDLSVTKAATATWPSDLVTGGYTVDTVVTPTAATLVSDPAAAGKTFAGSVTSATVVSLGSWAASDTNALTAGANAYDYWVYATKSAGAVRHVLEQGTMTVGTGP